MHSQSKDRLAQQTEQQQQIIDAVDASRKQLTQRIIDLDGRVNRALSPGSNSRAVFNRKGGVGKSSIAVNLAGGSANAGFETPLMDLDVQGIAYTTLQRTI